MMMKGLLALLLLVSSHAFIAPSAMPASTRRSAAAASSQLFSATKTEALNDRRRVLLSRKGPFFNIDRSAKIIGFGATANLVTKLDEGGDETIKEWLSDERRVALSIWEEGLMTELGNQVFRLEIMKLQFVTLQLQPSVDVRMWTQRMQDGSPVFLLQSVAFDPKIQVLPGLSFDADSFGIQIEVVGELRPDGKGGVTGRIAFQTTGKLTPPFRIVPDSALRAASDTINNTITQFAIRSFQKGAIGKYNEFKKGKIEQT